MRLNQIILSVPTSGAGATPAATFAFQTSGYKIPHQGRSSALDTVHNQNGVFRYIYDNGPNSWEWEPFDIVCSDTFSAVSGGGATQQDANLAFLWKYIGPINMRAPEGTYVVSWAPGADYQPGFQQYPASVGDKMEKRTVVNFIEGG